MFARFARIAIGTHLLTVLCGCQNNDKAAELAVKEQELAAREQTLALAAREQAVAAREQAAAQAPAAPLVPAVAAGGVTAPKTTAVAPQAEQPPAPGSAGRGADQAETPAATPPAVKPVKVTVTAAIDMTKPGGQQWDGLGDAPDPLITATVSRTGQSATSFSPNSLNASGAFNLTLLLGDEITFNVVDKDLMANDPIGSFSTRYDGRAATRSGKLGAGSISVTFSP